MAKRVPRTRNGGTQTEAQFFSTIRSALRSAFKWWRPAKAAKDKARVARGKYKCASCGGIFGPKQVEVDHITPCGSLKSLEDLPGFVERLTPEDPEAYQVLCKECHLDKSYFDRYGKIRNA